MTAASGNWFGLHHHGRYSVMDGMNKIEDHVARALELGYPALALTDHGTMAGVAELYRACQGTTLKPLPGIEAYASYTPKNPKQRKTFHVGLVALDGPGYLNLVAINNAMARDFYYKPILDLNKVDELDTRGVILTTGCFFGLAMEASRADPEAPYNIITTLSEYFDVFIEAQCHGIVDDDHDDVEDQYKALRWSQDMGLPLVLGQDCHYIRKDWRKHHDVMKRLGSWSDDPDSAQFPGEYGYHMMSEKEARATFEPEVWAAGMRGMGRVLEMADPVIAPLEKFNPIIVRSGDEDDRIEALFEHPLVKSSQEHRDRLKEEIEVIEGFGFSGYMLLVADIVEYLRKEGIRYNVRGSAVGSLVCHLLGITSLDPLEWSLGFDRFLSRNRAKLPDIDIDVDSSRRKEVVDYLKQSYRVVGISNYAELSVNSDEDGQFKGSAVQRWITAQRKRGGTLVPDSNIYKELGAMCGEGDIIGNRSRHASGLIVAPDDESMKYLPLGVIGSKDSGEDRVVSAYDMDSVEAMGYIKVDILGVAALQALDVAAQESGVDPETVPLDDKNVYGMIAAGMTEGVFQLEGWAAQKGVRRMRPTNIDEVIAAMGLFRPAVMNSGGTNRYLERRSATKAGKLVDDGGLHADVREVLKPTYGVPIYQEQMIDLLKVLGFSAQSLADALKAVKASNSKVGNAAVTMKRLIEEVHERASDAGWGDVDVELLEDAMKAYAEYGFNKAHATSYGLLAYRTAWMSYYHPGPFWQGMITAHGKDSKKVAAYTRCLAGRRFVRMPVDVNTSGKSIRVDVAQKRLYPALTTIDGIGPAIAGVIAAHAPYYDLTDFANKLSGTSLGGIAELAAGEEPVLCAAPVGTLAKAGALRSLT